MTMRRREVLLGGLGALAAQSAAGGSGLAERICLFTDHLAGFEYQDVARMLRELRVSGPDLTVRRGGLVKPERVAEDLPKAANVFREAGLTIPMITTGIVSAADPATRAILRAASQVGVRFYKLGYFTYKDLSRWRETMESTRLEVLALAKLGAEFGIQAGIHNHSGPSVGGAVWDAWEILQSAPAAQTGFFFDPAQATIEGGRIGWNLNFRRVANRLKMIALKDFVWEKGPKGWKTRWVPLGEGMVDWPAFFPLMREAQWPGPISLHIEYDPGGATRTERYDKALAAAARDLQFLRKNLI
jgi:L-ribulose-5-phosphate 3-epimerase